MPPPVKLEAVVLVSGEDIRNGVKAMLETVFPGETIYENLVPQNFERPSSLVTLPKLAFSDMANEIFSCQQDVEITLFMPVDDYYDSQVEVLEERMRGLCDQLSTVGYLEVAGRALDIESVNGALGYDYATITFTLAWQEYRKRAKDYELMEHFYLRTEVHSAPETVVTPALATEYAGSANAGTEDD